MISNIMPYCFHYRQHFNFDSYFYVEVRNECSNYINMTLEYKINGKIVTKPSPTFGPGKMQRIIFQENATDLFLRIFDSAFAPPAVICTKVLSPHMINRYKVIGQHYGAFQCISI